MKFLKFSCLVFPLFFSLSALAQNNDKDNITNPGTGTFPIDGKYSHPEKLGNDKQLEMQREEENLDSFGEDKYNENIDPDDLENAERMEEEGIRTR